MLYLSQSTHQELYISYKRSSTVLSVMVYFTLHNKRIHNSLIISYKDSSILDTFVLLNIVM